MLLHWPARSTAQPVRQASEESIKAAYIYKFVAYVEWPEGAFDGAAAPLVIGIIGSDALTEELEALAEERSVEGRPIRVRRVRRGDSLAGLHILVVAAEKEEALAALAARARALSILVITESPGALEAGSVINFRQVDERIRFEVSLDAADESNLSISSRLLAVAEHVKPRSR